MAGVQVEAGSELAQSIQTAVQGKLIENGWVAEENDATLSEYVTMMMVNGKDAQGVASELGTDLLMVGEDDPAVRDFAQWLFEQVNLLAAPAQQQQSAVEAQQGMGNGATSPFIPSTQDSAMDDSTTTSVDGIPSGPKAMRNGVSGRGGRDGKRMLGQLNSHMNRDQSLPDPLRRIKGAAGGQHGRIDSHTNRGPPRGSRGGLANGVQRMMNGRGGRQGGPMAPMNPMQQQQGAMMGQLEPSQQMAFMQMMEMQANMMQQMMQGGQMPNFNQQPQQNEQGKSLFDRVDKRQPNGNFKNRQHRPTHSEDGEASMDLDGEGSKTEPFSTPCRFNNTCTNPTCPFAHQSPAAPPGITIDLNDTCSFGAACSNHKCVGRHPSPAQRAQHLKQEVDCKFFPNCHNPACPFKHPDMPPCRNGADCAVPGCSFTHSKIACRYKPCTKVHCPFKHAEGQKGVFKDKVWTPGANDGGDGVPTDLGEGMNGGGQTAGRFAGFMESGEGEELILPGQQQQVQENGNATEMQTEVEQVS